MTMTIPYVLIAIFAATIAAILCIVFVFLPSSKGKRGILGVVAGILASPALLLGLIWAQYYLDPRILAYKQFYREIRAGMTRAQVLQTVEDQYPAKGKRGRPTIMADTPERLGFFMNPEGETEPNCEGIFLTLRDGVVVEKEYMAD